MQTTVPVNAILDTARRIDLSGSLVPGFVDIQVNGGGGILFNNQPDLDAIRTICVAQERHRHYQLHAQRAHDPSFPRRFEA